MNPLLADTLTILSSHYSTPGIEEVAINRPGEVWLKPNGGDWAAYPDERLSEAYLLTLCRQLANISGQIFHPAKKPILYTTLPEGHRFTAVVGGTVRYEAGDNRGVAITVRVYDPGRRITFDRYGLVENTPLPGEPVRHGQQRYAESPLEDLLAALRHREAILISGATSTGKTSFLNAMVTHLPAEARILTVEDTREVLLPHRNRLHLVVSRTEAAHGVDFMAVVDAAVRLTPDVIICGEIGIGNAPAVFRLMTPWFRIFDKYGV